MGISARLLLFVAMLFFPVNPAHGQNLQSAKTVISNPNLSNIALRHGETSTLDISFYTEKNVDSGAIAIILPASTATQLSNDGFPDGGTYITNAGFDLNKLTKSDVTCNIPHVGNISTTVIPSSTSTSHEHEVICSYTGLLVANSLVSITIGNNNRQLINPEAITSGKKHSANIHHVEIKHLNEDGLQESQITTSVSLINEFNPTAGVGIQALVGSSRFSIYGFTSPHAVVMLDGQSIQAQTTAESDGYFAFRFLFSPYVKQEVCLASKDSQNRISQPVCLPPFPVDEDVIIGPVLISPTLSINKISILVGDTAYLSGQTIPKSGVSVSFFTDDKPSLIDKLEIVPRAHAYTIPEVSTVSDENGNYEMTIPTELATNFKIFSIATFEKSATPKSTTLTIDILSWIIVQIRRFWPFLWILLLIIAALVYTHYKHSHHPLALYQSRSLMLPPTVSLDIPNHPQLSLFKHQLLAKREP